MTRPADTPCIKLPELLAPAGSPEAFKAAVAAGADAIYISGQQFGARKFARNFTRNEIESSIRYAHTRGVRVYVTVNTLMHDRELFGVAEYLVWLYSVGVDAVLVQDMGVAARARRIVPDLVLHASTQLTIHSADGVQWAAEQGFSRVVLARELPLAEVREIAQRTGPAGIGLEVFVHGALCYGYSGQCLLSSVIGGRSGNRGMCAQPCRKPYTLVTGDRDDNGCPTGLRPLPVKGRYLLSPKDLAVYPHLDALVRSPIASLKIEGRMKSPEYVAIVVSIYRRALDAIARGIWKPTDEDMQDLLLAFNRGFTQGYLMGDRHAALMGRDRPDNQGLCIGTVTRWDERSRKVTVTTDRPVALQTGDGLLFSHPDNREAEWGFSLNNLPVREKQFLHFVTPRPVVAGARLYLTSSAALLARARQIIAQAPTDLRHSLPVDLKVTISPDGTLVLDGSIDTGTGMPTRVTCTPDFRLVPAQSRPLTQEQIENQIVKTGGTPFAIRKCSIQYPGGMFAPVAELNRIRRDFLTLAEETLVASHLPASSALAGAQERLSMITRPQQDPIVLPGSPVPVSLMIWTDSVEGVQAAAQAGAGAICFEPAIGSGDAGCSRPAGPGTIQETLRAAWDISCQAQIRFVVKFPRITRQTMLDAIIPVVAQLHEEGLEECMVEGMGAAQALLSHVPGIQLAGSTGLNIFNGQAVSTLSHQPFRLLTVSPELSGDEIAVLVRESRRKSPSPELAMIVEGAIESMITEDCLLEPVRRCRERGPEGSGKVPPFYGICDETGRVFPVHIDAGCRTHISNAVETCLIDHLPAISRAGIGVIIIDARGRTAHYTGDMVRIYREARDLVQHQPDDPSRHLLALKERIKKYACGGITAGPFLSGLKED